MEQQVIQLLQGTISPIENTRKSAELQIVQSFSNPAFPVNLLAVAQHASVEIYLRQAALVTLKNYIAATWSPADEGFEGTVFLDDATKAQVRNTILAICLSTEERGDDSKVKKSANACASKIASADFPSQWPDLLPTLMRLISNNLSTNSQVHGALRLLVELVESGFNEDQFFTVASDLVSGLYNVATNGNLKPITRALAMSVFRSCFDTLEMVMEEHKTAVKAFLDEALRGWMPFFLETIKIDLPQAPSLEDETNEEGLPSFWRGLIALKLQVVKALYKIRYIFPTVLTPHSTVLFSAVWEELTRIQPTYQSMFMNEERQGRLEDSDNLPYTLDFLILEELDFMTAFLRAPPVRSELEGQLKQAPGGPQTANWLQEVLKLVILYAQISTEEEGLWDIDVNLFLSEETSVTANYTPRTASADLVIKGLGEWLKLLPVEALLVALKTWFINQDAGWKVQESGFFILNQLLRDLESYGTNIPAATARGFLEIVDPSLRSQDAFLRARAYLLAGSLTSTVSEPSIQPTLLHYLSLAANALRSDPAELVQVACIRALQDYLREEADKESATSLKEIQPQIIAALSDYVTGHDLRELNDSDDLKVTLIETLRDVVNVDVPIVLDGPAIDLLFTIASYGATNFQVSMVVTETFESIVESLAHLGHDKYSLFCAKVIPSLIGAFDVGNLTHESALTNLAADLVAALAQGGPEPLPDGFIAAIMPKLNRVLLEASEAELVRPATLAVKYMLSQGHVQFFQWSDPVSGKGAVEVLLVIIDRLLSQSIDDSAASEVGGLAVELVEKAGSERLGPFLPQLLTAVAQRLVSATMAQFIQSLCLVFTRLCLNSATDVVDFLSQLNINGENGLAIVLAKWLENSVNFAGYDEIRQNVIALSKLYSLQDPRLSQIQVKGDLIIQETGRIKTRSQAKLNPDQYSIIPANLKILKILVDELHSATSNSFTSDQAGLAAAVNGDSGGSDDGDEWEDMPGSGLDLGTGLTKQQLMGLDGEGSDAAQRARERDSETADYLTNWFREISQTGGFAEMYAQFNEDERGKLQAVSG